MRLGRVIDYKITIEPTKNKGFVVKVGCALFAFSTKNDLLEALRHYLTEPKKWESEYKKIGGITDEEPRNENIGNENLEAVPTPNSDNR